MANGIFIPMEMFSKYVSHKVINRFLQIFIKLTQIQMIPHVLFKEVLLET